MTSIEYMPPVGKKFYPDGSVRSFPGNTVICFMHDAMPAYQHAQWVQNQLREQPFFYKIALLPPESFHMTVFQLLLDEVRQPEQWSTLLPIDARLEETDALFESIVSRVEAPTHFKMRYKRLKVEDDGISIRLAPADADTEASLWKYRKNLAAATGIRFPDHDSYEFHITLAYHILCRTLAEDHLLKAFAEGIDAELSKSFGTFETDMPQLAFFDDMFRFVTADQRNILASRQLREQPKM